MSAALVMALLAAACASAGPGPLGNGGYGGEDCTPAPPGHKLTVGLLALPDTGTSAAVLKITSVRLTGDHGLAMGRAWLAPIVGNDLIGFVEWPPGGPAWARREPAVGAVIRPGQTLNLVFPAWRTGSKPGTAYVMVGYTANGNAYTVTFGWQVAIAVTCNPMPD